MNSRNARPTLLYLVTEDWYFCSHRLVLAKAAKAAGYDVAVAARVRAHGDMIRDAGLTLIPVDFDRRRLNPAREAVLAARLAMLYRELKPRLVHQVAMKPVLYGTLAALAAGVPRVLNALAGLGFVFTSDAPKARLLRRPVSLALGRLLAHPRSHLLLQNKDDLETLVAAGAAKRDRTSVIRGSGVDLEEYRPVEEPAGPPLVVLPARLLRDKGVEEFAAAASMLKERGVAARFALVGDGDPENPTSLDEGTLRAWREKGVVELFGRREDMPAVLAASHVVCLPSYREGLPKALLEAAASGRPIVATDVPGCREIVRHEENGLLVPARDAEALAAALGRLIDGPALRCEMGARGRDMAREFSVERVIEQTLALYERMLRDV